MRYRLREDTHVLSGTCTTPLDPAEHLLLLLLLLLWPRRTLLGLLWRLRGLRWLLLGGWVLLEGYGLRTSLSGCGGEKTGHLCGLGREAGATGSGTTLLMLLLLLLLLLIGLQGLTGGFLLHDGLELLLVGGLGLLLGGTGEEVGLLTWAEVDVPVGRL